MKVQVRRYGYWFLVRAPVASITVHLWIGPYCDKASCPADATAIGESVWNSPVPETVEMDDSELPAYIESFRQRPNSPPAEEAAECD